jgi:hypothetical protein
MTEAQLDLARRAVAEERARIARFLRSEPEKAVACDGHRHKDGKPCVVFAPMTLEDMADAVERGEHRREEEK